MVLNTKRNGKGKGKAVSASSKSPLLKEHVSELSSSSSSSLSSSDSDPTSDSESSSSDSEFGVVSQDYLDSLLEKAKASMKAKALEKGKSMAAFGDEDEIRLGRDQEDLSTKAFPSLDSGALPRGYFDFETSSRQEVPTLRDVEAEKLEQASSSLSVPAPPVPAEPTRDGRKLMKKEKKAEKSKSTVAGWFDLPAPDAADLPRLYREVEALRLRNALDPKRFYKKEEGEGKGIKGLPKNFAIGTIVPTATPFGTPSSDNLTRAERKRTIVDELVDDSEAKRYAKKKFEDLQAVRGARGRGTLARRQAARKPKW